VYFHKDSTICQVYLVINWLGRMSQGDFVTHFYLNLPHNANGCHSPINILRISPKKVLVDNATRAMGINAMTGNSWDISHCTVLSCYFD